MASVLEVSGLTVELATGHGPVRALDGVSLAVEAGQTLGLLGESGSGKSLTALAILGLLPPAARVVSGSVRFRGEELAGARLQALRGDRVAMVFQEPMTALNPVLTVGEQVAEVARRHLGLGRAQARAHAIELLRQVGMAAPEERADQHPHQLSGGLRQRAVLAMALCCGPDLLVADEPTTALDVTVQAQILELLRAQQRARGMAMLLISHDVALLGSRTDAVAVMYGGRVVEHGPTQAVLSGPRHPYTRALLQSLPRPARAADGSRAPLPTIPGSVPPAWAWPSGCRFRDRCDRASTACATVPGLAGAPRGVACHHPGELAGQVSA